MRISDSLQPDGLLDTSWPTVRDVNLLEASAGNQVPSGHPEGILAMTNHGTVVNAFSSGVIGPRSNDTSASAGGLVGSNFGTIARSSSSATVYPDSGGGGLVSDNYGTITQSYATGMVQAIASRSPAAGLADHNVGTISQSFAAGRVLAFNPLNEGGICVRCTVLGSDVYWNKETTGQAESGGNLAALNGLTTAQMSDPKSFVGWNFGSDGAWVMPTGATHPVLRWQVEH